jgi:hypothetical protein
VALATVEENSSIQKPLAESELEKAMLKELAKKNF